MSLFAESEVVGKKPASTIAGCGACGISKHYKKSTPKYKQSKILIIMEGDNYALIKKAFGSTILFEKSQIINVINCDIPSDYKLDKKQVVSCRPNIERAIKQINPHTIILCGLLAVQSVIGSEWHKEIDGMNLWLGRTIPSQKFNAWLCPVYSPKEIEHSHDRDIYTTLFDKQIKTALKTRKKKIVKYDFTKDIQILTSEDETIQALKKIRKESKTIAFDYETTGLKPDRIEQEIVSCSICSMGDYTISFMCTPLVNKELRKILKARNIGKIASNMKFEERWTMAKLGCGVNNWIWDTVLAAHILDNRKGGKSIKFLSYIYLGVLDYDSCLGDHLKSPTANGLNSIRKIREDDLLLYNGLDSVLEYEVAMLQMKEFGSLGSMFDYCKEA